MWTHSQVAGWYPRSESFRLGSYPEPSACWRGTRKSWMRWPSWYLTERNAWFRPNIQTVLWSALVAMKLTTGLWLDNIVGKRLSTHLSGWAWKFSFPVRTGSKKLLVCLGSPAVLRTAYAIPRSFHQQMWCQAARLGNHTRLYNMSVVNLTLPHFVLWKGQNSIDLWLQ